MTQAVSRARALVVSPAFFGYERDIVAELERQGYETTFLDERPSNGAMTRAVLRARRGLVAGRIEKYYRAKMLELSGIKFDLVLVVKAEVIPRWFVEDLRRESSDARFVFYSWDALSNVKNCLDILDCFDELLSFDPDDVAAKPGFSYLPLFYTDDFSPMADDEAMTRSRRYTFSFVGTLHTERYALVKKIFAGRKGAYAFFYVQARWYFAVVKYLTREHSEVPWRDVSFNKLSRQEVANIFRDSIAVVDMPRRGQSGLTIRTFEVLASGSILVTTNEAITREPFFDPARIIVVAEDRIEIRSDSALAQLDGLTPPPVPPTSFRQYSLESWVRTIANGCGG